ncbi:MULTISPECIES: glycosyltransferase family 2 protein [Nocardiaceae]|uniref:glycosyltransferase family 2 protein n=1 Tax=Nocardiaceae TaxID=85025 RepID=UPI000689EF12
MTTVEVIIVNFRSALLAERCIDSIDAKVDLHITLVDNSSGGTDFDDLRTLFEGRTDVTVVSTLRNLGFGGGVNYAAEVAHNSGEPDYLWVLNPDTVVTPGCLDLLVQRAETSAVDILSPFIVQNEAGPTSTWFQGGEIDPVRGRSTHPGIYERTPEDRGTFRTCSFCSGAAMLISWYAWKRLGGFDERFFLYWEDADLSLRARDLGMRVGIEPEALVVHAQGGSTGRGYSTTYCYYYHRNRLTVFAQSRSKRVKLAFLTGLVDTVKYLVVALARGNPSRRASFEAGLAGVIDGIRGVTGQRRSS